MAVDLIITRESTIPFSILGLLIFIYAIFSISRSRRNKNTPRKPPPEAGGAWPLIGHLHHLGGTQPPHITLGNMADKYGPIFTLRLGVYPTLIVSSWEIARECFTVNDRAFASRPKLIAFDVMGYNFGMIAFSPYGAYWRHVRKIATLEVLSNHRLEMLKHVRESEVKSAMKETYDRESTEGFVRSEWVIRDFRCVAVFEVAGFGWAREGHEEDSNSVGPIYSILVG